MAVWWYLWVCAVSTQFTSGFAAFIICILELCLLTSTCFAEPINMQEEKVPCSAHELGKIRFFLGSVIPFSIMAGIGASLGLWVSVIKSIACSEVRCMDFKRTPSLRMTRCLIVESALSGSAFLYGLFPLLLGMMQSDRSIRVAAVFVILVGLMPILLSTAMGGFLTLHYLHKLQNQLQCEELLSGALNNFPGCLQNRKEASSWSEDAVEPEPDSIWFLSDSDVMPQSATNLAISETGISLTKTSLEFTMHEATI